MNSETKQCPQCEETILAVAKTRKNHEAHVARVRSDSRATLPRPVRDIVIAAIVLTGFVSSAYATDEQFCKGFAQGYVEGWNGDFKFGSLHHENPKVPNCNIGLLENDDNSTLSSFEQGEQKGIQRGIKAYKDDVGSGSPADLARRAAAAAEEQAEAKKQAAADAAEAKARTEQQVVAKANMELKEAQATEAKRKWDADAPARAAAAAANQAVLQKAQDKLAAAQAGTGTVSIITAEGDLGILQNSYRGHEVDAIPVIEANDAAAAAFKKKSNESMCRHIPPGTKAWARYGCDIP